jgi:hypothetical protein
MQYQVVEEFYGCFQLFACGCGRCWWVGKIAGVKLSDFNFAFFISPGKVLNDSQSVVWFGLRDLTSSQPSDFLRSRGAVAKPKYVGSAVKEYRFIIRWLTEITALQHGRYPSTSYVDLGKTFRLVGYPG